MRPLLRAAGLAMPESGYSPTYQTADQVLFQEMEDIHIDRDRGMSDDALASRLAVVLREHDPVPRHVTDFARNAFSWMGIDTTLESSGGPLPGTSEPPASDSRQTRPG